VTTVQITLPDELAEEAKKAGVLSSAAVEQWLREQLRLRTADSLISAMHRMADMDEPALLSPEEVAREIAAMRAEVCGNSASR